MGADVVARGSYECAQGCHIGGHCPGHPFAVWYREGSYYLQRGERDYREALCLDANMFEAVIDAMREREAKV